jgi:proline dehydrogenase
LPSAIAEAHLSELEVLSSEKLDCYLSIKAPALGYAGGFLYRVLRQAQHYGVGVHFDSHGMETADETFSAIDEARRLHDNIGCTLPGRWRRSVRDAERAVRLGLNVRVVKGQWADPADPKRNAEAGFLSVIDRLAGRARYVAVATHDTLLAAEALKRLRSARTPCGLELLFALPVRKQLAQAEAAGVRTRFYAPYGYPWLPYHLSDLPRSPRILRWVLYDCIAGRYGRHPHVSAAAS